VTAATGDGPFRVLGIAPTLDPLIVKRGYFAALTRHPPHVDAEGFRRLRQAYEKLSRPDALTAVFMSSPLDVAPALAELDATIGQEIARTAERDRLREQGDAAQAALLEALSRLALPEALRMFEEQSAPSAAPGSTTDRT
jgi:hypothetical protein